MSFEELTSEEKKVLTVFIELMEKIGRRHSFTFLEKVNGGAGGFCIYKEDDKWITYTYEKGLKLGYREYDKLYDLCMDIFEALEKKDTDYCLSVFPTLVQEVCNTNSKNR